MLRTRLHIVPYEPRHRSDLLHLSYYSRWTHQHLDWHRMSQWLDDEVGPVLLAWQGEQLMGYIGLSRPLNGSSWIRLLGIRDGAIPAPVIQELWHSAQRLQPDVANIAVLMTNSWLAAYVHQLGFTRLDSIITLGYIGDKLPAAPVSPVSVAAAGADDLPAIAQIDHLAFHPPWQMRPYDLRQAFRISTRMTIAVLAGETAGYQISAHQPESGHLARLAVAPAYQGMGIGSTLLHETLREFNQAGIHSVTVNTQQSNLSSQYLYRNYGFFRNGFDHEVWHKTLA